MARQQIGKVLSGGVIVLCVVLLFTPVTHSQGITARVKQYTISGSVGMPGVTMQGLPGAPQTDENGVYSAQVNYNWSGRVTPVKAGYTFSPAQKDYANVKADFSSENYAAELLSFTISGSVGEPNVVMEGLPGNPVTNASGRYTVTVDYGWSGMVIPKKTGFRFDPSPKMYSAVERNLSNQDYTAHELTFTISGSVGGADGVVMQGLPGNPVTRGGGVYKVEVPYGWSGTVTPTMEGHEFTPTSKDYSNVMEPWTNENYTARVFMFVISGSTGLPGVTLEGLPDNPMTEMDGSYAVRVPYGWKGTVKPMRPGYIFTPASKPYAKVVADHDGDNYNPEIVKLTLSGNTGTGNVTLEGLPGNPTSDATGFFTASVEYGWGGSITPMKEGWSFEPSNKIYSSVVTDQMDQRFKASPIKYTISGHVIGMAGVMMDGLPNRPVTGPDGSFTAEVPYKWTGVITPRKPGYTFEPASRPFEGLLSSQTSQDFQGSVVQLTISGRIMSETGGVADVTVTADNNGGVATTDANGEFQLAVDYGWQGRITPSKEGYTFNPPNKLVQTVVQNIPGAGFIGKVRMMTITDSIVLGTEPIQGVTITAEPSGTTASTDTMGKYTIRVPYGWTGDLIPTKEGFEFEPASLPYTNVVDDIDKTARPSVPSFPQPVDSMPVDSGATDQQSTTPEPQPGPTAIDETMDPDRQALLRRIELLTRENDALKGLDQTSDESAQPLPDRQDQQPTRGRGELPPLTGPGGSTVLDVLMRIYDTTGVKIAVDATVKPDPVRLTFDPSTLTPMQVPQALQHLLDQTEYKFKAVGDTYLVYLPISNTWVGQDLRNALQDIALSAGVTIVPDPNVYGEVYADLIEVDLDTALRTILAGSPFVVQTTPDYYLVADRSVESDAFPEISETHNVYLNYRTPRGVLQQLSTAFADYVRADITDPNSHIVSVTAPPDLARRIVNDIRMLDLKPRHVLLDARVVVMERTNLLNVGVEWGWPQVSVGAFGTSFDTEGGGSWPWGIQMGYTPDQTFTNSLLMALNLLEQNQEASVVSNPQVLAQDGRLSELGVITEEYFLLTPDAQNNALFYTQAEMVTIESGTRLSITPRIGDNNDITLEMATEVSDSVPKAAGSDLPVVTRRTAKNVVTVKDGGTVALAGLTENRVKKIDSRVPGLSNLPLLGPLFKNKDDTGSSREIAVFVTAHLVPDGTTVRATQPQMVPLGSAAPTPATAPLGGGFSDEQIRDSLARLQR